jgi:hypothetical protein
MATLVAWVTALDFAVPRREEFCMEATASIPMVRIKMATIISISVKPFSLFLL